MWVHAFLNSEQIHNRNCPLLPQVLRFTKKEQPTAPGLQQVQMVMQQFTQKPQIPQVWPLVSLQPLMTL